MIKYWNQITFGEKIIKTIILVLTSVGVGKGISLLRELIIAYYYGLSETVDFFMLAFTWLTWFSGLWMSVTYSIVVPLVSRVDIREKGLFESEFIGFSYFLGFLSMMFMVILSCFFMEHIFADISSYALRSLTKTFLFLSPLSFLSMVAVSYLVLTLVKDAFISTLSEAVAPALASVFLIFYIWVLDFNPDSFGLIFGCLLGYLVWAGILIRLGTKFYYIIRPSLRFRSKLWKDFYKNFGVMFSASAILSLILLIDQKMAIPLGAGSVATLGYCNRLIGVLFSVSSLVLTRTFLPSFSVGYHDNGALRHKAIKWGLFMLSISLPFTGLGWQLSHEIVTSVFERGSFSAEDANRVGNALRCGFLQLPFYVGGSVLNCYLTSVGRYSFLLLIAIVMVVIKIVANYLLIPFFAVSALFISGAIMYFFSFLLSLSYIIRLRTPSLRVVYLK